MPRFLFASSGDVPALKMHCRFLLTEGRHPVRLYRHRSKEFSGGKRPCEPRGPLNDQLRHERRYLRSHREARAHPARRTLPSVAGVHHHPLVELITMGTEVDAGIFAFERTGEMRRTLTRAGGFQLPQRLSAECDDGTVIYIR